MVKQVEISQVEMERDKVKFEYNSLQNDLRNKNLLVEDLEKELVQTKQKLGDVLNEMSEVEQVKICTEKSCDKKNKKNAFTFFSKNK